MHKLAWACSALHGLDTASGQPAPGHTITELPFANRGQPLKTSAPGQLYETQLELEEAVLQAVREALVAGAHMSCMVGTSLGSWAGHGGQL